VVLLVPYMTTLLSQMASVHFWGLLVHTDTNAAQNYSR